MREPHRHAKSLCELLGGGGQLSGCRLWAPGASVAFDVLARGTCLGGALAALHGRSVLVATERQLTTALALVELDGVVRRLILCPPGLSAEHLSQVIASVGVDAIVTDRDAFEAAGGSVALRVTIGPTVRPIETAVPRARETEWVMLTSGSTGKPKMVVHSLESLIGAIRRIEQGRPMVWGTFYDIRRFGGLQIFFRSILGGASLVLSDAGESMASYLDRAGALGVTHISGTPSQWRNALVYASSQAISPQYIRLSGEIADQALLDSLHVRYPQAAVAHAYASTEAGVGFEVDDGLEGFPARLLGEDGGGVEMKILDGSLRIRSSRTASRYVGADAPAAIKDAQGFVDTGDLVQGRGQRYYFVGRRDGIINVGGLKVHPEEVEAVINRHPDVRGSLVRSRKNFITGQIVVADVVLRPDLGGASAIEGSADVKREILATCRQALANYKVPAAIRFVAALELAATGKSVRT